MGLVDDPRTPGEIAETAGWRAVNGWSPLPMTTTPHEVLFRGLSAGVSVCCIAEFIVDLAQGRLPAVERGTLPDQTGRYVPCSACRARVGL